MKYAYRTSPAARVMCVAELSLVALSLAAGLVVILSVWRFENPARYASGLALGGFVSLAKILLLDNSISDAMGMGKRAIGHMLSRFAMRSAATMAALALALAAPGVFGFIGTVVGILSMAPSAIIATVALARKQNQ